MKKIGLLWGAILVFFSLSCANEPKEVLIDSFEGSISKESVDFGSSEGSSLQVSADKATKACGSQSLKITYELKPSGYMWIARGYGLDVQGAGQWEVAPQNIAWKKYDAFSVAMYGRNWGGVIAFDIKDNGGEMWRFLLDDDFIGFKEITCPFSEFFARGDWQPETAERNEILDFPVKSFQFEPRLPGKGTYYFDCVKVLRLKK